ncbi:MAG: hypothetical protein QOH73_223 [Gaiellaceae bacterium]|nr:hypothetical protein [Gaiellaceae bacterium]
MTESTPLAWGREHAQAIVAIGVTLVVAATIVLAQPITSPWWIYGDADATYTASGLQIAGNRHTRYLDHPGLPIQQGLAIAFDAEWLVARAVEGTSHRAFVNDRLLHLDRTRGTYRTLAIALFLLGALLACVLVRRLLDSWLWGLAAGVLWIAAPDGARDSIQIRPETLLTLLCLVAMYYVSRGARERSARLLGLGAFTIGFAAIVKLHAVALLAPLALAALVARPGSGWGAELVARTRDLLRRRRVLVGSLAVAWVALALRYTLPHRPFEPSRGGPLIALGLVVLLGAHAAASFSASRLRRPLAARLFDPFHTFLFASVLLGVLVTVAFVADDGLRGLSSMRATLTGGGVNTGIEPFTLNGVDFGAFPLQQALVIFVIAGVAAAIGIWRRDLFPVLWFTGAAVLAVLASARLGVLRYYAPPFVVAVPAALWLLQRLGRAGAGLGILMVAYVCLPQFQHLHSNAQDARLNEGWNEQALVVTRPLLRPGEAILVADGWPNADGRYFSIVQLFTTDLPAYPYRYLPDTPMAAVYAKEHGLALRYYVGPLAKSLLRPGTVQLQIGPRHARPVPGTTQPNVAVVRLG